MADLPLASTAAGASGPPAETLQPLKGAGLTLGILCFVYVLNFLDRQLLSILAKPIQDELGVTDGQLGMIGGLYFALFYCVLAIPVGYLADRTNRVRVLGFACALWSAATMACGMSANYAQLVVARMTVGVGEAGGVPPSYAIISDYFPPGRRATALSLFNLGPPIGQALGVAFGAAIAAAYSWRAAFLFLGAVGIVAALVVLFAVREPVRGGLDPARGADAPPRAGFWPTVRMFFTTPSLILMAAGAAATQIVTYGSGNFTTLLLIREKGMTLEEVAVWYAIVVAIGMGGGIFASGRVLDHYTRRAKAYYATIPALTLSLAVLPYLGFVWAPTWPLAIVLLLGPTFLNYFYLSSCVTFVQENVAPEQRVLAGSLLLLVANLTGMGVGPTFVGAVSDALRESRPEHSLQFAFYALTPFYGVAIAIFLVLAGVLRREARAGAST